MKTVKVAIEAASDDEVAVAIISYQRKRGDTWIQENQVTILSDQPENERTILLDDDQRLVIEGQSNKVLVQDVANFTSRYETDPEFPKRFRPTPPDRDGEEKDTPDLVKEAQRPENIAKAQAEEARAAAITQGRQAASAPKSKEK